MAKAKKQQTQRVQAYLLTNVLIFVAAAYVASSRHITGLELSIFSFINNLPNSLFQVFLVITQAGSAWMLFGLTLILLGLKRNRLALRVFGVGAAAFVLTELAKQIVARPRPELILDSALVRDHLLLDYGFPSGHTAVATAVGLVLIGIIPKKWRWVCWLGIVLVGLSRIYLGVHAPLDVVGGFNIGVIVVCASLLVRGKLKTVLKITRLKFQG